MTYTQPLLLIFLLFSMAGLWRLRPGHGWARKLLRIGIGGMFLVAWPPVAWLSSSILEGWYSPALPDLNGAGAIVVLSANVIPPSDDYPVSVPDWDTYERSRYAAWVHREIPSVPIVTTGGRSIDHTESFAATMRDLLVELGVPGEQVLLEERSSSTYENAVGSTAMLRGRGIQKIVVVTQAYHMVRAEQCFRKLGMDVIPAPCGFQRPSLKFHNFLPAWQAVRSNERTLHEILGLLWYKAQGRV